MTLLLMTGYLTINKRGNTYDRYELKIPNEEIKQMYIHEVQNHLLPDIEKNDLDKKSVCGIQTTITMSFQVWKNGVP